VNTGRHYMSSLMHSWLADSVVANTTREARRSQVSASVLAALGILLLVAAGLKTFQLSTEPIVGRGLLNSRGVLLAVVEIELLFGAWLLSGLFSEYAWCASLLMFSSFALVSAFNAISGADSCGCFGDIVVNPWITLLFDCAVVATLICFRPCRCRRVAPGHCITTECKGQNLLGSRMPLISHAPEIRCSAALTTCLVFGLVAGSAILRYQPSSLSDVGEVIGDGSTVILEPEAWLNKRFPLLDWIVTDANLFQGTWTVVLYREGCEECSRLIRQFEADPDSLCGGGNIAFISVEPCGMSLDNRLRASTASGCLVSTHNWFVETPVILQVQHGEVRSVTNASDVLPLGHGVVRAARIQKVGSVSTQSKVVFRLNLMCCASQYHI
jgi:hypothetical protein